MAKLFDFVVYFLASAGALWLVGMLVTHILQKINPPKIQEDEVTRLGRLIMEAQDEYTQLIKGDLKRNYEKIKANICYQSILQQGFEKVVLEKRSQNQKEAATSNIPDEDFSEMLLKKKLFQQPSI
jgi:hypothetical protein